MDDYSDDLGYHDPDKFICTDPGCEGSCGAYNHPVESDSK